MTGHHLPEHHTQRVKIRTDVHADSCKLLGTGKLWCPCKAPGYRNRGLRIWFIDRLGEAEVDNFRDHCTFLLQAHHDVAWFNVSVNELLLVHRGQTGSHLRRDFEHQLHIDPARALDEMLKGFPFDKFHRVEVILARSAQVEDRGNVRVTNARRSAGFPQKTKSRRFITEVSLADDFQCHGAVQVDVERLISDAHGTATQLDRSP